MLDKFPEEIKQYPQWCLAGANKEPLVPMGNQLYRVSVTDLDKLMDFENACLAAQYFNTSIGFVLSSKDPFACIDLDVKDSTSRDKADKPYSQGKWTTVEELERYYSILHSFDSYCELSNSQKGFHVWIKANIGEGRRRGGVEVYSQERFIICTGVAIQKPLHNWVDGAWQIVQGINEPKPLTEQQQMLSQMVSQLGKIHKEIDLVEIEPIYTDEEIWNRAIDAENADKFNELCAGRWQDMGFPSQSEADLALMSMFTFYSESNEQCRRLFRMTQLGKREKAIKDNVYINRTLRIIRAREEEEKRVLEIAKQTSQNLLANAAAKKAQAAQENENPTPPTTLSEKVAANVAQAAQEGELNTSTNGKLSWPPGVVGEIAKFIYYSSPRPVKEVSIVSALGFIAGLCGKTWNIPGSGLNLYIILVARSGIGKEAMHSGISLLASRLRDAGASNIDKHINFVGYASGPALRKAAIEHKCMVNVAGEFGRKLKRMADDKDSTIADLRTVMTDLYQKSGKDSIVGGVGYSNKESDVDSVSGVAYSMIGETTPNTLYESLTNSMMEDGFLSRFTIVEYDGERPEHNHNANLQIDQNLLTSLYNIVNDVSFASAKNFVQQLGIEATASSAMTHFDKKCDKEINGTKNEAWRQMWNRAHLKSLRIAALLAVADAYANGACSEDGLPIKPILKYEHYDWAKNVVLADISLMSDKLTKGDVGTGDNPRELKIHALIKEFILNPKQHPDEKIEKMRASGVITRGYLARRVSRITSFERHRSGTSNALDITLRAMADNGYILELGKADLANRFGFSGKAYQVLKYNEDDYLRN